MVNPAFCKDSDLINGLGGFRASGRWHRRGHFRCLYVSDTPETALREVLAASRRKQMPDEKSLPRTLVALDIVVGKALDVTDAAVRRHLPISAAHMVEEHWWTENYHNREAWTQALGRAAFHVGWEALRVPAVADRPHGVNLIVFPENLSASSRLRVVTPVRRRG